jgi:hypothetical protein
MKDYKKLYLTLFNYITDSIIVLESEIQNMKEVQKKVEEMYIADDENDKDEG